MTRLGMVVTGVRPYLSNIKISTLILMILVVSPSGNPNKVCGRISREIQQISGVSATSIQSFAWQASKQ